LITSSPNQLRGFLRWMPFYFAWTIEIIDFEMEDFSVIVSWLWFSVIRKIVNEKFFHAKIWFVIRFSSVFPPWKIVEVLFFFLNLAIWEFSFSFLMTFQQKFWNSLDMDTSWLFWLTYYEVLFFVCNSGYIEEMSRKYLVANDRFFVAA